VKINRLPRQTLVDWFLGKLEAINQMFIQKPRKNKKNSKNNRLVHEDHTTGQ
jgi:hypothetical protein